jgi:hypothetical protein
MGLLLFILFACLCLVVPPVLCGMGKVSRLTVCFWWFFGITALINASAMNILYERGEFDNWEGFVGPALVQVPFGFMIYGLERPQRRTLYALVVAVLGSFLVTGLWLLSSALFIR